MVAELEKYLNAADKKVETVKSELESKLGAMKTKIDGPSSLTTKVDEIHEKTRKIPGITCCMDSKCGKYRGTMATANGRKCANWNQQSNE